MFAFALTAATQTSSGTENRRAVSSVTTFGIEVQSGVSVPAGCALFHSLISTV